MDWGTLAERGGIALIALAVIYFAYQGLKLILQVIANNTAGYEKLSTVLEYQSKRDEQFQKDMTVLLQDNARIADDSNRKITEIHKRVVGE